MAERPPIPDADGDLSQLPEWEEVLDDATYYEILGVLEIADMIAVTKADGDNVNRAKLTASDYQHALRIITPMNPVWAPPVVTVSALENKGLDKLWEKIAQHRKVMQAAGEFEAKRRAQQIRWMWSMIDDRLMSRLRADEKVKRLAQDMERRITSGKVTPALAADKILEAFWSSLGK